MVDGHTLEIAHFLTYLSLDVYNTFGIQIFGLPVGEVSPLSTQNLIENWKCVDAALTRYTSISQLEVSWGSDEDPPQDNKYTCIADLFRDLLPEFTSRVPPETECHTGWRCFYDR